MRINVGRVSRDKGACLEFALEERFDQLEAPGEAVKFSQPVRVGGTVTNTGKCLVVQGKISAGAELTCDRCLAEFPQELTVPFEAEFFRQGAEAGGGRPGEARESLRREEEAFLADNGHLFRGEDLELTEAIRQELSLALPIQRLCREDCAGLCPVCGANLNATTCTCERPVLDPRLAALQGWLNRENAGREV
jgi:uncharacterized protein